MKKVCGRFCGTKAGSTTQRPYRGISVRSLQDIARSFIKLQEARHAADYDLSYKFSLEEVGDYVQLSIRAMQYWQMISLSAEANIFILSLLMWKNWDKDRP